MSDLSPAELLAGLERQWKNAKPGELYVIGGTLRRRAMTTSRAASDDILGSADLIRAMVTRDRGQCEAIAELYNATETLHNELHMALTLVDGAQYVDRERLRRIGEGLEKYRELYGAEKEAAQ